MCKEQAPKNRRRIIRTFFLPKIKVIWNAPSRGLLQNFFHLMWVKGGISNITLKGPSSCLCAKSRQQIGRIYVVDFFEEVVFTEEMVNLLQPPSYFKTTLAGLDPRTFSLELSTLFFSLSYSSSFFFVFFLLYLLGARRFLGRKSDSRESVKKRASTGNAGF